jgi:hypothetical protein
VIHQWGEASGAAKYRGSVWIPQRYVLAAAADHCLAAAYRGECHGVDPDALMRWRVEKDFYSKRPKSGTT